MSPHSVEREMEAAAQLAGASLRVGVMIVARRVLLSASHRQALFGDQRLTSLCTLVDGTQASASFVVVRGQSGELKARVMVDEVEQTRVELPLRDHVLIDDQAQVRLRSDVSNSPGCVLEGAQSTVVLADGILNAPRRLELGEETAQRFGVRSNDVVRVRVDSERAREFAEVVVRVRAGPNVFCLDLDEASTVEVNAKTLATVLL